MGGCATPAANGVEATGSSTTVAATSSTGADQADFDDASTLHSIEVSYDEDDYQAMLDAHSSNGDKNWISATVTIDGATFERVGIGLNGNSTLKSLSQDDSGDSVAPTAEPGSLPWLIRLDEYLDGQAYQGRTDFVVRGSNSETSLDEAVALYVIGRAGLATEAAALTRFSVDECSATLRLVIEGPDDG